MTKQIDFTARQMGSDGLSKWAVYLPALSFYYSTMISQQRFNPAHIPASRLPSGINSVEDLNWLNDKSIMPYRWSLYSGGHADLDMSRPSPKDDMVRNRDPDTFLIGDSGGFQVFKGVWPGDWRAGSGCKKAEAKRSSVLQWMDSVATYGMVLDVPSKVAMHERGREATGITSYNEAIDATLYNNDYFLDHRRGVSEGGARFLNVLQGSTHQESLDWYEKMKHYCDPGVHPQRHLDGWSFADQNSRDVHLTLLRLVDIVYDGLLQEGVHDWIHFLGVGRPEWALILSDIQRSLRRHVNPNVTISYDAATPFITTVCAAWYTTMTMEHNTRWAFRTSRGPDDRKYSNDTRAFRDVMLNDGFTTQFDDSVVSAAMAVKDVCYYQPGQPNKTGKVLRTSWDSITYLYGMAHNVWIHLNGIQTANEVYDRREAWPTLMWNVAGDHARMSDLVEDIFSAPTKEKAVSIIERYTRYWPTILASPLAGKKNINAHTMFNTLFDVDEEPVEEESDEIDDLQNSILADE